MTKLIIFDWDDVITIGSKYGYFACYSETIKNLGVIIDTEELKKRILSKWGRTHRETLIEVLREHPNLLDTAAEYTKSIF